MKIINKEKFENFIKENAKGYCDIKAYYEDLERDVRENASSSYEMSAFETKTGKPEVIYFDTKTIYQINDEWIDEEDLVYPENEEFDDYEIEIIF